MLESVFHFLMMVFATVRCATAPPISCSSRQKLSRNETLCIASNHHWLLSPFVASVLLQIFDE